MSKKLLPILFIIVLLASFFLMWNYTHQDVPLAADPVPVEDPVAQTDPESVEGTDEIAWNYDEFPEDYTFRSKK